MTAAPKPIMIILTELRHVGLADRLQVTLVLNDRVHSPLAVGRDRCHHPVEELARKAL
jgi:hypothetical protein